MPVRSGPLTAASESALDILARSYDKLGLVQLRDDILDEARQELALRYLRESTMPIGRIAKLLGYATVGAFYDAFHRWMSVTPADYRRSSR